VVRTLAGCLLRPLTSIAFVIRYDLWSLILITTHSLTQVGWMTADNASNNDTAMKEVALVIDPNGTRWELASRRIRCQEHILNLAARHFVDSVSPTPQAALLKKIRCAIDNGDEADLDKLNQQLATLANEPEGLESTKVGLDAGDAVGKALALIEQVWSSEPRNLLFMQCLLMTGPQITAS
jgi:hypothetical protein